MATPTITTGYEAPETATKGSTKTTKGDKIGTSTTDNSGGTDPQFYDINLFLQILDTKVSASEDRLMLRLAEKTTELEKELSRQMADVVRTVHGFKPGAPVWQNAILIVGGIGIVFAILAFASDRFDSGVSSMGAVEEELDAQREINANQDLRLDKILTALEEQRDKPKTSP